MAQVLVRNVHDGMIERLKSRAGARGSSLEGLIREILVREATGDRADVLARIDAIRDAQPAQWTDSTDFIRARRDGADELD